jgi:hypothetical protein
MAMEDEIRCRRVEAYGLKTRSILEVETARLGYMAVIGTIEPSNRWRNEAGYFYTAAPPAARGF